MPRSSHGDRRTDACARPAGRPPGHARRRAGRARAAQGRVEADPARGLPAVVRERRRPGPAQVREPATRRVVQDPRRLHPDVPAQRRGTSPRRRCRQRRQPRPGRRAGRRPARHQVDGLHARGRPDPQGVRDAGLRRGCQAARSHRRRRPALGVIVRPADRRRAHPSVRPRGHRRRPGHGRPGDPRAGARRPHDRGLYRRRRAGRRHRIGRPRPAPGGAGGRRAGGGRGRIPALSAGRVARCCSNG